MAYWMLDQNDGAATSAARDPLGGILPPIGRIAQAGAFGAILSGATTGAVNAVRVKNGEIDKDQAVRETVQVAARGAASMAIASVAAHVARAYPLFGIATLLCVGVAAVALKAPRKPARAVVSSAAVPTGAKPKSASVSVRTAQPRRARPPVATTE